MTPPWPQRHGRINSMRDILALLAECDRQIAEMEGLRELVSARHLAEFDEDLELLRNLRRTYEILAPEHSGSNTRARGAWSQ